jgi:fatty acid desaturase
MNFIYLVMLVGGWAYLASAFHWSHPVLVVVILMTIEFTFYVSRVVGDDR